MTYMTFNESDLAGRNAWFRECKERGIPCVMVLVGPKGHAAVDWDCFTAPRKHGQAIMQADVDSETVEHFYWAALARTPKEISKKCVVYGSAFEGRVTGLNVLVAKDVAEVVASHLADLTQTCRGSPALA